MIRTAASQDEAESIRIVFNDLMLRYRGTMPAEIVGLKRNDSGHVFAVDVRPSISQGVVTESGLQQMPIDVLTDLPLAGLFCKTTGLYVTIPFQEGDECFITCCDRGIDNWQWNGGTQPPTETHTPRQYDLNDAVVMVGAVSRVSGIQNYSSDSVQIRDRDAQTVFSVKSGEIREKVQSTERVVTASSVTETVAGTLALTLTSSNATFGVPIIDSNGVNHNTHGHDQGADSAGNSQVKTGGPS